MESLGGSTCEDNDHQRCDSVSMNTSDQNSNGDSTETSPQTSYEDEPGEETSESQDWVESLHQTPSYEAECHAENSESRDCVSYKEVLFQDNDNNTNPTQTLTEMEGDAEIKSRNSGGYSEACRFELGNHAPSEMSEFELLMIAFSSISMFPQCAACGEEDIIYGTKGRSGNDSAPFDAVGGSDLENSTIRTESIHEIDDGDWKIQYQEMTGDYPDYQTIESTIPSTTTDDPSFKERQKTAHDDTDQSTNSEHTPNITEDHQTKSCTPTGTLSHADYVQSQTQPSVHKRCTSWFRRNAGGKEIEPSYEFNRRSRSVPPAPRIEAHATVDVAEIVSTKIGCIKNLKEAESRKISRTPRARGRQRVTRSRSRGRSARRANIEVRSVNESVAETKRPGRGLFSRFRSSSRMAVKEEVCRRSRSPALLARRQRLQKGKITGVSSESFDEREDCDGRVVETISPAADTRETLPDRAAMVPRKLVKEEIGSHYLSTQSSAPSSVGLGSRRKTTGAFPKRGSSQNKAPKMKAKKSGKGRIKGLFQWKKSKIDEPDVGDDGALCVSDEVNNELQIVHSESCSRDSSVWSDAPSDIVWEVAGDDKSGTQPSVYSVSNE